MEANDVVSVLDRIAAGENTEGNIVLLRSLLSAGSEQNTIQLGKFNVNIGNGQDIHIGDIVYQGASADIIRDVIRQLLDEYLVASKPNNYNLGINYLDLNLYDQAISSFEKALAQSPKSADVYYYLALAFLKGRRPKDVKVLGEVDRIERHLETAINLDSTQAHYYYLWAWVKHDYHVLKQMRFRRPPSYEDLLRKAEICLPNFVALKALLKHIPPNVPDSPVVTMLTRRLNQ